MADKVNKADQGTQTKQLDRALTFNMKTGRGAGGSKQLPSDPFAKLYGDKGLVVPPYNFDKLLELKESNPIHGACIAAKATDIAGLGWQWVSKIIQEQGKPAPTDEQKNIPQREKLQQYLEDGNPDITFRELCEAVWNDYESMGWGIIEVTRNLAGIPSGFYHVPAQTMRAHNDGIRFCQIRNEKTRWFKKFGVTTDYGLVDGATAADSLANDQKAGEVIVIKKAGGRSSYYGIPEYISSLGAIIGSIAARDFNIDWFKEKTIPDVLLVIEGAELGPKAEAEIRKFFQIDTKASAGNNKVCILPIPSEVGEKVTARIEKLQPEIKDGSFRLYRQDTAMEICVAHRVPPYRIGWPIVGSLGGSTAKEMNDIYKRSVIEPGQQILEHRLNNILFRSIAEADSGIKAGALVWRWKLNEIDLSDKLQEMTIHTTAVNSGIENRNEAREAMGKNRYDGGDVYTISNTQTPIDQIGQGDGEPEPGIDPTLALDDPNQAKGKKKLPAKAMDKLQKATDAGDIVLAIRDIMKMAQGGGMSADDDILYTNWIKRHHTAEVTMQGGIESFFDNRRRG